MSINDCEGALTLWRRCEGIRLSDDDSPECLARQLTRNPGLSQVVVVGDQVVGAILCLHDGRRGVIRHLAIDPSYRRRGLGRRLVKRCLGELRARGLSGCNVFVLRDNREAGFWSGMQFAERENIRMLSVSLGQPGGAGLDKDEPDTPAGQNLKGVNAD